MGGGGAEDGELGERRNIRTYVVLKGAAQVFCRRCEGQERGFKEWYCCMEIEASVWNRVMILLSASALCNSCYQFCIAAVNA